jgi:hypothetical protein
LLRWGFAWCKNQELRNRSRLTAATPLPACRAISLAVRDLLREMMCRLHDHMRRGFAQQNDSSLLVIIRTVHLLGRRRGGQEQSIRQEGCSHDRGGLSSRPAGFRVG